MQKDMRPLWKVIGFFNRTSWKASDVQIVRETGVLVANDTSNHLVADSLRSVLSLEESGTCLCLCSAENVKVMESQTGVGERPSRLSLKVARCPCSAENVKVVRNLKQTRVNGGSVCDSLKVTSSECQSNGNLGQAWVNGGRDSLKIASALNFQSDGNSNTHCSC